MLRLVDVWRPLVSIPAALLVGCSGTIFNPASMESGDSFFVDARQRVISNTRIDDQQYRGGQITPKRIVCAEPSPDVALAMAHSLGTGVNVFGYGSGNLSTATSQALSQLGERFAAVQLLRDVLYRSCEAYANGAISNTTYALMMARLDETTTTLLLGEMAAGAFGRQLAGGQAAADSKSSSSLNETRSLPAKPTQASNGGAAGGETGGGSATPASGQAKSSQIEGKTEADLKTTAAVVEGVGKISERSPAGEVAAEVARIHKAFLDDDNLDALLVACITSLSHEGIKDGQQTSLSQICKKEIFENFVEKAAKVIETKARAEVLITRARTATVHSEAIAKCLDVFKSDATPCLPLINATPNLGAGVTVTKTSVTP